MMKFLLFFQLDLFIIIMLKVGGGHCELIWHSCVIPTDTTIQVQIKAILNPDFQGRQDFPTMKNLFSFIPFTYI